MVNFYMMWNNREFARLSSVKQAQATESFGSSFQKIK